MSIVTTNNHIKYENQKLDRLEYLINRSNDERYFISNNERKECEVIFATLRSYLTDEIDKIDTIQQLWNCINNQYTYAETKIHMNAYRENKTTTKKVVVVEKEKL